MFSPERRCELNRSPYLINQRYLFPKNLAPFWINVLNDTKLPFLSYFCVCKECTYGRNSKSKGERNNFRTASPNRIPSWIWLNLVRAVSIVVAIDDSLAISLPGPSFPRDRNCDRSRNRAPFWFRRLWWRHEHRVRGSGIIFLAVVDTI